jgi:hypothetical protein
MTTTTRTARPQNARHDTTTGAPTITLTLAAAELRRIVLAVEKSAAKDDSRPVLAGIQARVKGDLPSPPLPETRWARPRRAARAGPECRRR